MYQVNSTRIIGNVNGILESESLLLNIQEDGQCVNVCQTNISIINNGSHAYTTIKGFMFYNAC